MGTNDCCCGRWNTAQGTRIIGISSAVISVLAFIGFTARVVQLSVVELPVLELPVDHRRLVPDGRIQDHSLRDAREFLKSQFNTRRLITGVMIGITVVSFVVAVLLIFAAKKKNRYMALPFMIWTILCTAGAGIFGVCLIISYPVLREARVAMKGLESIDMNLIPDLVLPFVFIVIMFKLYTWWLIVVFNFYNRLKYAVDAAAFDSIPMQTA